MKSFGAEIWLSFFCVTQQKSRKKIGRKQKILEGIYAVSWVNLVQGEKDKWPDTACNF